MLVHRSLREAAKRTSQDFEAQVQRWQALGGLVHRCASCLEETPMHRALARTDQARKTHDPARTSYL